MTTSIIEAHIYEGPPAGGPARGWRQERPESASAPHRRRGHQEPAADPGEPPDDKDTRARRIARVDDDLPSRTRRTLRDLAGAVDQLLDHPQAVLAGVDSTVVESLMLATDAAAKLLAEMDGGMRPPSTPRDALREALHILWVRAGCPGPTMISERSRWTSRAGYVSADTVSSVLHLEQPRTVPTQRTVACVVAALGGNPEDYLALWARLRLEQRAVIT